MSHRFLSKVSTGAASLIIALGCLVPLASADTSYCAARDDTYSFTNSHPLGNLFTGNVTQNDVTVDYATAQGSSAAGYDGVTQAGAKFTLNQHGYFEYVPANGYVGTDHVFYTLTDKTGVSCSIANITFNVNVPQYQRVAANPDSTTTVDTSAIYIDPIANDLYPNSTWRTPQVTAVENQTLALGSFSLVPNPSNSFQTVVKFTPTYLATGTAHANYTFQDGYGDTATSTLSVMVTHINVAPAANSDTFTTPEDTPLTGNVLTNDTDPDSTLTARVTCAPDHGGTVVMQPGGTFTYTPAPNFNGRDTFCYQVSDGQYTSNAMVWVDVTPVNDAPVASFTSKIGKSRTISFDASTSSDIDGSIVSYHWDFGDGTSYSSTTPYATHSYRKGSFMVTLTVIDNLGSDTTISKNISLK